MEQTNIDNAINNFMSVTAKSNVAIIIPLYGFWDDIPDNPVNGEVLKAAMLNLHSSVHTTYNIFVAHQGSLPGDATDPNSVTNVLLGVSKMGNSRFVPVERNASYNEYIKEGLKFALEETKAQFIVIFNPWVLIQDGGIDAIIDRSNRGDRAKVISGHNLKNVIKYSEFKSFRVNVPSEYWDFSFNFVAMQRYVAEMIKLDMEYTTHDFMQRDIWQQVVNQGFSVIESQRIPIFSLDFPWEDYEKQSDFEFDRQYFAKKWRFDPGLVYGDKKKEIRDDKKR